MFTLTAVTVNGNLADSLAAPRGSGIYNDGILTATHSAIAANTACRANNG